MRHVIMYAIAILLFALHYVNPCIIIAVGKNGTEDGSILLAHTDDAGGGAADLRLVRVPAMNHEVGDKRPVYEFFSGYPRIVAKERGQHYYPKVGENLTKPLGYIPQVNHTYAYFDQDYGMMNEVQLSIAESTCASRTVGWAKSVPYGYNLFGIAELSKIALERCESARCAIQTMGDLAVKYGFYSEDSGNPNNPGYADSAESLGIADRFGEVWIFHVLTGPNNASAVWAAQRVPEGHVSVVANGFVIRQMNLSDTDNFMASDNVLSFAQEMGWWDPQVGPFDFTSAYVGNFAELYELYVGRRVWRVFDLVAPSLKLDSRLGFLPSEPTYPFSVEPDELVSMTKLMSILKDHYEGTEYDMTKGIGAGPFGNPVRFDGPNFGVKGGWERSISIYRAAFSFVLQVRPSLPNIIGGVAWYGHDAPHGTAYIPFYCSQRTIPQSYLVGKQSEFNSESSWWAFNFVNNWSQLKFSYMKEDIAAKQEQYAIEAFEMQQDIDKVVLQSIHSDSNDSLKYIETRANQFADRVVDGWWKLAWTLVSKYSNGYILTGENPSDMKTPGYGLDWLKLTEFNNWPGQSLVPPKSVATTGVNSEVTSTKTGHHWGFFSLLGIGALLVGVLAGVTYFCKRRRGYSTL